MSLMSQTLNASSIKTRRPYWDAFSTSYKSRRLNNMAAKKNLKESRPVFILDGFNVSDVKIRLDDFNVSGIKTAIFHKAYRNSTGTGGSTIAV